ncbi:MAG: DciA family protein [Methylotenera sp.]
MRRFNALLNQPELTALNARNRETQATQKIWEAIAPDNLAQLSHATTIKDQQFTIFADNNAVAAKIKLFIPSLLIKLEKLGCEVTLIRVKVQVKSTPQAKSKPIKKLSLKASAELNQLAKKLSGTALGDALTKLAKKAD